MACNCKGCNTTIDGFNGKMIMLYDYIWKYIVERSNISWEDSLCIDCIECVLERSINSKDYNALIPVNELYDRNNK